MQNLTPAAELAMAPCRLSVPRPIPALLHCFYLQLEFRIQNCPKPSLDLDHSVTCRLACLDLCAACSRCRLRRRSRLGSALLATMTSLTSVRAAGCRAYFPMLH